MSSINESVALMRETFDALTADNLRLEAERDMLRLLLQEKNVQLGQLERMFESLAGKVEEHLLKETV